MGTLKYIASFLGVAILFVIVFVRAGERGGLSGGEQAGRIIQAGTQGLATVITAATGG